MYRTIPIRARFTDEEKAYWIDQCQNANSLINCAIYYTKQNHYQWREKQPNANSPQMGKRGNQNFMPIPTGRLIERLKQLAGEYGIVLTLTEEAYTSRASFLDGDSLPKHGEKPGSWTPSGTRVKRGLYKASGNRLVNADCNGAGNILRKVAIQLGLNLAKVGKGSLTLPKRYDLFSNLKRSYREQCEALRFQASA